MGKQRGFTLVELMIVVAILGIMLALVVMGIKSFVEHQGFMSRVSSSGMASAFQAVPRGFDSRYPLQV